MSAPLALKVNLPTIEVYFSPTGGATGYIVRERNNANRETLVQAYSFISAPIAKAFVITHNRPDNDHYRVDELREVGGRAFRKI